MRPNNTYTVALCIVLLFAVASAFCSCRKKTEIRTITEVKTDTVTVRDTVILVDEDTVIITNYINDSATTFILSRHAETTGSGSDPFLSAEGQQRADTLAYMLRNTTIHAVYATNYNRTKQTAAGIAADNSLVTQIYDPAAQDALVTSILAQHRSKVVYIAGHSNTIPVLLNILAGGSTYTDIPHTEYDNLYIVNVFEKGRANVVHLKY